MKFFEPDVLVEAEPGLAASIGYGALAEGLYETQLLGLDDLYSSEDGYRPGFRFGLSVIDAYEDIYQSQRQFVLRDSQYRTLIFNDTKPVPHRRSCVRSVPARGARGRASPNSMATSFRPAAADLNVEHWFQVIPRRCNQPVYTDLSQDRSRARVGLES